MLLTNIIIKEAVQEEAATIMDLSSNIKIRILHKLPQRTTITTEIKEEGEVPHNMYRRNQTTIAKTIITARKSEHDKVSHLFYMLLYFIRRVSNNQV
jgi:hypothetical protein